MAALFCAIFYMYWGEEALGNFKVAVGNEYNILIAARKRPAIIKGHPRWSKAFSALRLRRRAIF